MNCFVPASHQTKRTQQRKDITQSVTRVGGDRVHSTQQVLHAQTTSPTQSSGEHILISAGGVERVGVCLWQGWLGE